MKKKAIILLSGGLDSATCLAIAVRQGFEPYALSFDYGQRHRCELEAARKVAAAAGVREHRIFRLGLEQWVLYAFILTLGNLKARGEQRYEISNKAKTDSWSARNMFVLGLIVLCGIALHLINFWSKMQLQNWLGGAEADPYMLMEKTFGTWWILVIYLVWFAALWFHLTHGFWSALQTLGWNNQIWFKRWKWIGCIYATLLILGFVVVAIYAFCKANGCC